MRVTDSAPRARRAMSLPQYTPPKATPSGGLGIKPAASPSMGAVGSDLRHIRSARVPSPYLADYSCLLTRACFSRLPGIVTRNGRLYTCGVGTGGRLGHGDHDVRLVPKRVRASLSCRDHSGNPDDRNKQHQSSRITLIFTMTHSSSVSRDHHTTLRA